MSTPSINIAYDMAYNSLCNTTTGSVTTSVITPSFYKCNNYNFNFTIYDTWPAKKNLSDIVDWKLGIGPVGTSDSPLVEANNASFTTTQANVGSLVVAVNTHSNTLSTDLSTAIQRNYYCEIQGNSGSTTISLHPIVAKNTVYSC
uniref:Uncharacterized protein n=1 Tax=viral metagenome TaxID=1070528 RepID=A0A6H1ZWG8_9ZZZZ